MFSNNNLNVFIKSQNKNISVVIAAGLLTITSASTIATPSVLAVANSPYSVKTEAVGTQPGQLMGPRGITIDSAGNYYVADTENNRIQKFNGSGVYLTSFGVAGSTDGKFNYPRAIALDSAGNIFVADANNHRVQKFNSSGVFLAKVGTGTKQHCH
jgi:DNA-binding beta-propeller fold protein YncE